MKAILIDDEPHCTDVLQVLLEKFCPEIEVAQKFNDPEAALVFLKNEPPELVFLDIEMPRLNGFDLLQLCQPFDFRVIFTTAYDRFAVRAFKFNALDYLLKPIDKTELQAAVAKAKSTAAPQNLQLAAAQHLKNHERPERIALPVGQELIFVEVSDIVACSSDGSYSTFFIEKPFEKIGEKLLQKVLVSKSLREIEDLLNRPDQFCRVHHSHLVNLKKIRKILRGEGGEVVLSGDLVVPVARLRRADLLGLVAKL